MTLREFVQRGSVGTRGERESFEQGLLESAHHAAEHNGPAVDAINADISESLWQLHFVYAKAFLEGMGIPMDRSKR